MADQSAPQAHPHHIDTKNGIKAMRKNHPKIEIPTIATVTNASENIFEPMINAIVSYNDRALTYINSNVAMSSMSGNVSSTVIRKTAIQRRISTEIKKMLLEANAALVADHPLAKAYLNGKHRQRAITKPDLEDVAIVFCLAKLAHEAPVRAVEHTFGVSYDQAKKWVHRARQEGALER